MTNFVNFITDRIRPTIIESYLAGAGTEEDFVGSDSSTIDYTRFGYVASVYRKMLRDDTVDTAVTDMVKVMSEYTNGDGVLNYKQKSPSGYSIADMMVYDARSDAEFSIVEMSAAMGDGFTAYLNEAMIVPSSSSMGSPLHMMVEFNLSLAISELESAAFHPVGVDESNTAMSPLMYALKRAADDNMSGDRMVTYNAVKAQYELTNYEQVMGKNTTMTTNPRLYSEFSKLILSTTHDSLKSVIDTVIALIFNPPTPATVLMSATTQADGLSKNNITFDLGIYEGSITGEQNKGYSPLFYYINRYKTSADVEVLTKLSSKYSPFNISVVDGITEGYTPMSLLAAAVNIADDGTWEETEIVAWMKAKLGELGATTEYEFFVAAGNVRDFTEGKMINAYGVVTNVFRTINTHHRRLKNNYEGDDFSFDSTALVSAIFPDIITDVLYQEWMIEFGLEM